MPYGIIEYNEDGLPKCEICDKYFKRVAAHVRQKHNMFEKEYKALYGFDLYKGICSKESHDIARQRVYENYDRCIASNLVNKGNSTRFVKGSEGRTKEKVSYQTFLSLSKRWKEIHKKQMLKYGRY